MAALRGFFRPEFLNRIHDIVEFQPLLPEYIKQIVQMRLQALAEGLLKSYGTHVVFEDGLVDHLVKESQSDAFGARHVQRVVDKSVGGALAERIASGELRGISRIVCTLQDGKIVLLSDQ